eukprot:9503056-Pyramimonas_sp.AAC.1
MTVLVLEGEWCVAPALTTTSSFPGFDLSPQFLFVVLGLVLEGRVAVLRAQVVVQVSATDAVPRLIAAQRKAGGYWHCVQVGPEPVEVAGLRLTPEPWVAVRALCSDGAPWAGFATSHFNHAVILELSCGCSGGHSHASLPEAASSGKIVWPAFGRAVVGLWAFARGPLGAQA